MKIVPATLAIDEFQISFLVRFNVVRISGNNGAIANQIKKAMKKHHHEQWTARMCGREKLHSLISVALSSWFGSTASLYSLYFFLKRLRR